MTRALSRALSRGRTLALLAAGAVVAWAASAQPWWVASGGLSAAELTGRQVSGSLTDALALVAGAGVALVLVLRTPGRRVMGALLALVGLGMLAAAAYRFRPDDATVLARLRASGLVDQVSVSATAWPWLYAAAGTLELAGAVLLLLGAARWPVRTDRFARRTPGTTRAPRRPDAGERETRGPALTGPAVTGPAVTGSATPATSAPGDDALLAWRALDAGLDPTLDPEMPAGITPDVHSPATGDTMENRYDKQGFVNPPERRTS